jgi:hypothetical protein
VGASDTVDHLRRSSAHLRLAQPVDLNCSLALNRDGIKLFGLNLDVLSFADFIALDDVG